MLEGIELKLHLMGGHPAHMLEIGDAHECEVSLLFRRHNFFCSRVQTSSHGLFSLDLGRPRSVSGKELVLTSVLAKPCQANLNGLTDTSLEAPSRNLQQQ